MGKGLSKSERSLDGKTLTEEAIDPLQLIVDAHHHLYDRPGTRYLFDDLFADLNSGHRVEATVFVQARSMLRTHGSEAMKPVGETEFANGVADMSGSGAFGSARACTAIVGFADLMMGSAVREVLDAHLAVAGGNTAQGGRFAGIRHILAWDPDTSLLNSAYPSTESMTSMPSFRAGFAELAPLGLTFDAWLYFHQLPHLTALACAFPSTSIVLNHCGGILGIQRYRGKHKQVFMQWRKHLKELMACPNITVKLGGLGMPLAGFGFEDRSEPTSSLELAQAWAPWMETCLDLFGSSRCMFESNFPADRPSYSYVHGWNAMKHIASSASTDEKADLFWRTAARTYGIRLPSSCGNTHVA